MLYCGYFSVCSDLCIWVYKLLDGCKIDLENDMTFGLHSGV